MKIYIGVLLLAMSTSAAHGAPELKGNPEELRQFLHPAEQLVTLTGTHEETAWSDKASVSLVITTEDEMLADSISANRALRTSLTRAMLDAGIDATAVKTSRFSTSPQFGWFGSKPKSFEVVNRMTVGITDESHLMLLARMADASDEVVMSSMHFEHLAKDELEARVKRAAIDDALAQKADYEAALGVKLVPVSFNERPVLHRGFAVEARLMEDSMMRNMAAMQASSEPAQPLPPQTFDEIEYRASVYVTFKVLPAD